MTTESTIQQQGDAMPSATPTASKNLTGKALQRALRNLELDIITERLNACRIDLNTPPPEIEPLISINGQCICSRGNISAIVGEAKSKKTFLCTALVASAMAYPHPSGHPFDNVSNNTMLNVAWMDTEQSIHHVYKVAKRINDITAVSAIGVSKDPRIELYTLREYSPKERMERLYDIMRGTPLPLDIVVIDGISDLMSNTNDLEESERVVGELMALSTLYKCHIICVLHTNPGSDKARGHIGSSLLRKCESVIYVHRVGDSSIVEPQYCRNEPFERFAFHINSEGLPELCALPTESVVENPVVRILRDYYGGAVERDTLTSKLESLLGKSRASARMTISRALNMGLVIMDTANKLVTLPGARTTA